MNDKTFNSVMLGIFGVILAWSAIKPYEYFTWFLEVFPALIALAIILFTYKRFPLTRMLCVLILIHSAILMIGGHYTYARVPITEWIREPLNLSRNHFDRIGHFAQGFVPAIVARELLLRTSPLRPGKWLFALIVLSCLGVSALYELLEWGVAASEGSAAVEFLAFQGDVWDTQKDMALCGIGAVAALLLLGKAHDRALARLSEGKR